MKKYPLFLLMIFLLAACQSQTAPFNATATQAEKPNPGHTAAAASPTASPTQTPPPTPTSHPLLQVPLDALEGSRLLFWHPYSGKTAETIESIIREFNQTNIWGVQVFTNPAGGSGALANRLEGSLDTGPLPHILAAPSEQILLWQENLSLFADLDTYIQDAQWGLTAQEQSAIPQLYWEQDRFDGQQIGIPATRDMRVIFYNQSWGKKLGFFSPPESWEGFTEQACAAAAERVDLDLTGGLIVDTDPLTTLSWILTGDPPEIHDPAADMYQFDSKAASDSLVRLRRLYDDGCAWSSRLPDPYQYFAERQALFYTGSLTDIPVQTDWMQRRGSPDEWTVLPFPAVEDGKPVILTSGSAYALLEASPEEQLASWLFIRWLMLPRHQALITEASGLLPVSVSAEDSLETYRQTYPQWDAALAWVPIAQPVPQSGSWTIVQTILEDAAWQTYQSFITLENIPRILEQVDSMIPEILAERE